MDVSAIQTWSPTTPPPIGPSPVLTQVEVADRNLEGAIIDIQEAVLRANSHATCFAVEALAAKTGKHLRCKAQGVDLDWNSGETLKAD